ncbi:RTA1 like protein [Sarocladium implicatum]|nr:RTA1 like protein [Sarocladium implicatum]
MSGDHTERKSMKDCTEVSDFCPVEATVLGYVPNLGASIFFTTVFGALLTLSIVFAIWKRTWTYSAGLTCGLVLETAGYIGRILLHSNVWDSGAFQLQICAIILGPTFICVSIYLTLKHVCLAISPELSRLRPKWYPIIFLPADLSCLIVQAIGGGIAAAAGKTDQKLLDGGNNAIIAGVALQVVVLISFGVMGADYLLRAKKHVHSGNASPSAIAVWQDPKFRKFTFAVSGAFIAILIRCIYRIAEMAGGWGNHIMQDEISFNILDPSLVVITTTLLVGFHPGFFFPRMINGQRGRDEAEKVDAAAADAEGVSGVERSGDTSATDAASVEPKPAPTNV